MQKRLTAHSLMVLEKRRAHNWRKTGGEAHKPGNTIPTMKYGGCNIMFGAVLLQEELVMTNKCHEGILRFLRNMNQYSHSSWLNNWWASNEITAEPGRLVGHIMFRSQSLFENKMLFKLVWGQFDHNGSSEPCVCLDDKQILW